MNIRRLLTLFAALATAAPTAVAQEVGGRYRVEGTAGGSSYVGVAEIVGTSGGNCAIRWTIPNTPPSEGICMRQGAVLATAYRLGDRTGLAVYRLGENGVLEGTWTLSGQEWVGRERLIPIR
jgi:hypothetical protein